MKTLLIGFYDYPFLSKAYELENDKITKLNLDDRTFRLINDYNYSWYKEDYSEKEREDIEKLFNKYERVIVCEDSEYKVLLCSKD